VILLVYMADATRPLVNVFVKVGPLGMPVNQNSAKGKLLALVMVIAILVMVFAPAGPTTPEVLVKLLTLLALKTVQVKNVEFVINKLECAHVVGCTLAMIVAI